MFNIHLKWNGFVKRNTSVFSSLSIFLSIHCRMLLFWFDILVKKLQHQGRSQGGVGQRVHGPPLEFKSSTDKDGINLKFTVFQKQFSTAAHFLYFFS